MYDLIVIGSGPAGLTAAIYASRAGLKFAVIEKEYMGTGQIAFTERVDNFPGHYGIDGFSLGESFREHAEALGTEFIEAEATALSHSDSIWSITTDNGVIEAKAVIIATGASPRRLGIKGEKEFLGRGVSYCALCDGAFFADRTVAVIGGGDTALSDALYLSKTSEKVILIHRRNEFRANASLVRSVRGTPNIELILEAVPQEIIGDDNVTGLRISQNGSDRTAECDGIFVAVGTVPDSGIVKGITDLDEHGYIIAGENCATSAEGLYAAGDVRTKQVRQVVTAAADGACAAISASEYISQKIRK